MRIIPASVGEEYWQGCGWCGWCCGQYGDGKEYCYPKAYPQNVRMCKSPVSGRHGGIEAMRSSAERVEHSRLAGGRPRSIPVCAVLIVTYHTCDCLEEDSSHLSTSTSTQILYKLSCLAIGWCALQPKTWQWQWLNWRPPWNAPT